MFDFKVSLWVFTPCWWVRYFGTCRLGKLLGLRFMVLVLMAPIIPKLHEHPLKSGFIA